MKNALKIGAVAQIGIYLHWTFGLLLAGLFAFYLANGTTPAAALAGIGMVAAVFACVVLHELGHALTARRYGIATRDITLYPIGGVARLERIPEEPWQEFWIALAGPAVNVVIAALLLVLSLALGKPVSTGAMTDPNLNMLATLMWLNVVLFAFNLLPAFPMDGGRVLRALLATRLEYTRATQIAASIGQGMAILFGVVGLLGFNPILLFIALFVYIGAQQEAQQALMRAVIQGLHVGQAMMTRFRSLSPEATLNEAVQELLAGAEQDFPLVEDGRIVGVLTRKAMMRALAEEGGSGRVGSYAEAEGFVVEDTVMLDQAFLRMQEKGYSTVPVVRQGRLVGLLTLENVGELLMVNAALKRRRRP